MAIQYLKRGKSEAERSQDDSRVRSTGAHLLIIGGWTSGRRAVFSAH